VSQARTVLRLIRGFAASGYPTQLNAQRKRAARLRMRKLFQLHAPRAARTDTSASMETSVSLSPLSITTAPRKRRRWTATAALLASSRPTAAAVIFLANLATQSASRAPSRLILAAPTTEKSRVIDSFSGRLRVVHQMKIIRNLVSRS